MTIRVDRLGLLNLTEVKDEDLAGFDCGTPHLNAFLTTQARGLHELRLGQTQIVFHEDFAGAVGFFTLSNDALPLTSSEEFELSAEGLSSCPAVKIGRMAVRTDLQRQGLGIAMIDMIIGQVLGSDSTSCARLLVVDADRDKQGFYAKVGFQPSLWAANRGSHQRGASSTVKMHLDILTKLAR